ncbi:hypothetical protein SEA_BONUM_74 [Gordonia phage Bonum]|uniref:DUF7352 domain-containing protein n=1 Tax=Gordonia phage Kabluna TaxID=2041511 RepID=A0A2D1GD34_9CAUD|nr:hypothetical protein KNT75_gp73 [Gordonia phage Kabluna]ATN89594.1 hypothetical protein SEA_KABLUNA_73 [Gordonia phage Kabluna]QXN73379.1 hypothetical protein SEA_BONUM_74 [Gordonia phage Bonum]
MRTIWKYPIPVTDSQQIKVEGATVIGILDAQMQPTPGAAPYGGKRLIEIWMLVDTHPDSFEFVPIEIRGTGHPLHEERIRGCVQPIEGTRDVLHENIHMAMESHIATIRDGGFVWHVFRGELPSVQ